MADNYIEKKMEELRSGIPAGRRASRRTYVRTSSPDNGEPGDFTLRFPELRVFVCGDATTSLGRAVVRVLREVGCKVAFSGSDSTRGTEMARSLGAQFHPLRNPSDNDALAASVSYTIRHWRAIDAVISLGFIPSFLSSVSSTISLLSAAPSPFPPSSLTQSTPSPLASSACPLASSTPFDRGEDAIYTPSGFHCVMHISTASDTEIAALCRLLLSPDARILPSSLVLVVPELMNMG